MCLYTLSVVATLDNISLSFFVKLVPTCSCFPPHHLGALLKKRYELNKTFTFTFSYLHLYMCVRCMDTYLGVLVSFYVLEGKCESFIEFVTFFHNSQGIGEEKTNT